MTIVNPAALNDKDTRDMQGFTSGYTDFNDDVADEIRDAHHLRYIRLPSGRKLYMVGTVEHDADEIADIQGVTRACNERC